MHLYKYYHLFSHFSYLMLAWLLLSLLIMKAMHPALSSLYKKYGTVAIHNSIEFKYAYRNVAISYTDHDLFHVNIYFMSHMYILK